jgi:hypothetical protein
MARQPRWRGAEFSAGIGLSHVACGNCHAMTTDTIFVDIDTKTRSVEAIYKTFGRPKRLGHNVVRDSGVGEG